MTFILSVDSLIFKLLPLTIYVYAPLTVIIILVTACRTWNIVQMVPSNHVKKSDLTAMTTELLRGIWKNENNRNNVWRVAAIGRVTGDETDIVDWRNMYVRKRYLWRGVEFGNGVAVKPNFQTMYLGQIKIQGSRQFVSKSGMNKIVLLILDFFIAYHFF